MKNTNVLFHSVHEMHKRNVAFYVRPVSNGVRVFCPSVCSISEIIQ
jgi:hypothetical protein